jgi:hypothetical protein
MLKSTRLCVTDDKVKGAGNVDQVVECLPRKHEVLSSNPSATPKILKLFNQ